MKNIFISYSSDDRELVENDFIPSIETIQGVKGHCWLDVNDIESGAKSFPDKITDGIKGCQIFLLMLTRSSQEKEWPLKELIIAEEHLGEDSLRHVVLVNLDSCTLVDQFKEYEENDDIIYWEVSRKQTKLKGDIEKWISQIAGDYYEKALALENDFKEGNVSNDFLPLLEKAAELEYSPAQSKLAFYYKKNNEIEKAINWCERARSNNNASAFSLLGSIYRDKGDIGNMIANYQESANMNWANGQYFLGKMYYDGKKLKKKDLISAIYWLKKAADQNQPDAQKLLGDFLLKYCNEEQKDIAQEYYSRAEKTFNEIIEKSCDDEKKSHAQQSIQAILTNQMKYHPKNKSKKNR